MRGRHRRDSGGTRTIAVSPRRDRAGTRHRLRRRGSITAPVAGLFGVLTVMLTCLVPAAAATASTTAGRCAELDIPVTAGLLLPATMHATLCTPDTANPATAPVQVLVAGGTYGSAYWSGLGITQYSYTAAANAAGTITLALDRIGTGRSSKPLSALVTTDVQASAIHQVIGKLRTGALDGVRHGRVALVGHSLGSMTAVIEAATYRDVDAVILTGYTHKISMADTLAGVITQMHPAILEGRTLDPGYLTTVPGIRPAQFYSAADRNPALMAAEERSKDIFSIAELPIASLASLAGLSPAVSRGIAVPVLQAVGELDGVFCGPAGSDCSSAQALHAAEAGGYSTALTTYVQPGAGHSLALARDGAQFAAFANTWLAGVIGGTR